MVSEGTKKQAKEIGDYIDDQIIMDLMSGITRRSDGGCKFHYRKDRIRNRDESKYAYARRQKHRKR